MVYSTVHWGLWVFRQPAKTRVPLKAVGFWGTLDKTLNLESQAAVNGVER
ncbi:hypothetical protein ACVWZJ_001530 [Thermostichus sp. OS-CIW-29]